MTDAETGEKSESTEFAFPGVEGISFFSTWFPTAVENVESLLVTVSDEEISDGHIDVKQVNQGNSIAMEGTIYVTPDPVKTYYFNPIYQSPDGRVYAMTGGGISASGVHSDGMVYSQTMDATYTTTENGKTRTDSISLC